MLFLLGQSSNLICYFHEIAIASFVWYDQYSTSQQCYAY